MFRKGSPREMKPAELEQARLGFNQYLRRRGFSPQFISRNAEELLATAAFEYSRKLAEGAEIENPVGWIITCASQRTKNLLEAERRSPRLVSEERAATLIDEEESDPEDVALQEDRFRKVREATAQLSDDERRLLALAYFEGIAVREAARSLGWHPSKAQRCHRSARKHLHEALGVRSMDDLEIEVGLAAYVSIAASQSSGELRAGVDALADVAARTATDLWTRAQDLARRLPGGGGTEPSATAALGGSAGRAAGVCASAAVACLASGVVGPGVGGVDLIGGKKADPKAVNRAPASLPPPRPAPVAAPAPPPKAKRSTAQASAADRSAASPRKAVESKRKRTQRATREATSYLGVESAGDSAEASYAPSEASNSEASEPEASSTSAPSSSSAPTPTEAASEQFSP